MNKMKVLHHNGEVVAINKGGKWESMSGVTSDQLGKAIHDGDIEYYESYKEESAKEIAQLYIALAVCAMFLAGFICVLKYL
jgi:hypothetical protein